MEEIVWTCYCNISKEDFNCEIKTKMCCYMLSLFNIILNTHSDCFYCLCFAWDSRGTDNFSIFGEWQDISIISRELGWWRHRVVDFPSLCDNQRDRSRTMLSIIHGTWVVLDGFSLNNGRLHGKNSISRGGKIKTCAVQEKKCKQERKLIFQAYIMMQFSTH